MKTSGQGSVAFIWGAGALLIAFGLVLILVAYNTENTQAADPGNLTLTYDNGSLVSAVQFTNNALTNLNIDNITLPRGNYEINVSCDDTNITCTHTYIQNDIPQGLALVEYIMGGILLLFGLISFYMAHQ